jgi:ferredoxin
MKERGSGPAMLLPWLFCPRDHVRKPGPFVQLRTSMSVRPNCCVKTLYCISSCPVGATIELCPASAIQSMKRSHSAQPCHTSV